jgi:hypothetical protein
MEDGADSSSSSWRPRVGIRLRPHPSSSAGERGCARLEGGILLYDPPAGRRERRFAFDHIAGPSATVQDLYNAMGKEVADSALAGNSGTLLLYGATASGKTYNYDRMIPLAVDQLLQGGDGGGGRGGVQDNSLRISFYQIQHHSIVDLLSDMPRQQQSKQLRESAEGFFYVDGLSSVCAANVPEALDIIRGGQRRRDVAATRYNSSSSRAHPLWMQQCGRGGGGGGGGGGGTMLLVDLAGSERLGMWNRGRGRDRLMESCFINKSLSALGNVISALGSKGPVRHVPFRDSRLTRLLYSSLAGNLRSSRMAIIATVSPLVGTYGETLSTLQFASRCMLVENSIASPLYMEKLSNTVTENQALEDRLRCQLEQVKKHFMSRANAQQEAYERVIVGLVERLKEAQESGFLLRQALARALPGEGSSTTGTVSVSTHQEGDDAVGDDFDYMSSSDEEDHFEDPASYSQVDLLDVHVL